MVKFDQEKHNPCLKEQKLTYKCFGDNNYDKKKCELQMCNYKECKAFWNRVRSERRRKGIQPYLPPPEERDQIKADYIESVKKSMI